MVNWGLAQGPNAFEQSFSQGIHLGQAFAQKRADNALSQYAINPSEENFASAAKHNPRFALQERDRMAQAQKQQHFTELRKKALNGDQAAQLELAAIDTDAYNRMSDQQREEIDKQDDVLAQAAFDIIQRPASERAAVWDAYAKQLGAEQYVGQYSDQMLNSIVSRAGIQERFQKFQQPSYKTVPEGGYLEPFQFGQPVSQSQPTVQTGPQGGTISKEDGEGIVLGWNKAGYATRDQVETIKQSMGGNQQAVDAYLQKHGLNVVDDEKTINGQTYYKVGNQWFDNPEGR